MTCLRSLSTQEVQTACDDATRVNRNDNVAMVLNSGFSPVHTSDYFTSSLVNDIANVNLTHVFKELILKKILRKTTNQTQICCGRTAKMKPGV